MIAPLSWLKQYININLKPEKLGEKLTEVGLGCEKITKTQDDVIFELEITPNRPDWLSIIGVAREIAAVENKKINYPKLKTNLKPKKETKLLPLKIYPNFTITPRLSGIIINNITVKESPEWLKNRLESIGQRSINNIVDITNYVMWELGNPLHSFDYHKIKDNKMWIKQSKGGEKFESVDDVTYHLPKDAITYEDTEKIFDLVGIKGGKNSGTYPDTKAVFIAVEVDDPVLIRKASQSLGLRSDASAIFERGVNKGGTIDTLKRTVDLILETAGGEIASELIDLKEQDFKPWKLNLRLNRLEKIIGIKIPEKEVLSLLDRLNLDPKLLKEKIIQCTIPTYRNDLQIEEDLIEEVARLYGYNNFPKTMPEESIPTEQIPYFKNYKLDEKIKNILTSCGFNEIYTYSLISEKDLENSKINSDRILRIDNPVSREFEYLRPTLKCNLLKAFKLNLSNFQKINLFELGKVYLGQNLDETKEAYFLSGISNEKNYQQIKGLLEFLFKKLAIKEDPTKFIEVLDNTIFFEFDITNYLSSLIPAAKFIPLPKYPSIVEDMSIIAPKISYEKITSLIKEQSKLIIDVKLLDVYENKKTFRITYQDINKNLTNDEISIIREKIINKLKTAFDAKYE